VDVLLVVLTIAARGLLGLVFLLAGASKARAPAAFEASLAQYRVVPARFRPLVAGGLPAIEILLGSLLVTGVLLPLSSALALALLVVFTAASLIRPKKEAADCGCFGSFGTLGVRNVVTRNTAFIVIAFVPLIAHGSHLSLESAMGDLPALALAATLSAVLLAVSRGAAAATSAPVSVASLDRRSFLSKLAVLGAGSVAAAALTLRGAPKVEAACYGCTSCGYAYYWIGCSGYCCAAFWQVAQDYCPPYCYACGWWTPVVYCNYPSCCF
jgi:uncharacterized membrane protein YphA (DoxX/SURF4 family)